MVEENGFKPNLDDAELPTKGLEKQRSSMWRKLSMCLLLSVVINPQNLGFTFGFHGDKKPTSCLLGLLHTIMGTNFFNGFLGICDWCMNHAMGKKMTHN